MLQGKAALEILCLPWSLKPHKVKCLCLNKHLSWEELRCWNTAGWELAVGPNWELRRILWQSWHLVFDCLLSTFRYNRYPGAGVTKLARCCCWFSNCTRQCGGIEGGDGCERNSCLENHRGILMPGILSYLLPPRWPLSPWRQCGTWNRGAHDHEVFGSCRVRRSRHILQFGIPTGEFWGAERGGAEVFQKRISGPYPLWACGLAEESGGCAVLTLGPLI